MSQGFVTPVPSCAGTVQNFAWSMLQSIRQIWIKRLAPPLASNVLCFCVLTGIRSVVAALESTRGFVEP